MRKHLALILALCLLLALTACEKAPAETEPKQKSYADVTACFVGDSITYGHTLETNDLRYWQRVAEALKFKEVTGLGINGSAYSTTSKNGMDHGPLTQRYTTIPQTDLIFIKLGTNDFFECTPLGTIEDKEDVSFYGAINFVLDRLEEQCPDSTVVLITPIRAHTIQTNKISVNFKDYVDAVKAVGEQRQLPVMDMHNITFDQMTEGFFNDAAHPNKFGNQVMGDALQKWLEENIHIILK